MERIYLDYAASTPLAPEAKAVIAQWLKKSSLGNPASLHAFGREAMAILDQAHHQIGQAFGVAPTEVIFTAGATESNNLAISGVLAAWRKSQPVKGKRPHIVISALEHPSIRAAASAAVESEEIELTRILPSAEGVVRVGDFLEAIQENTALVSCLYVQNEIGTIQPVGELAQAVREQRGDSPWPVTHIDAVQAFPYRNCHVGHLKADLLTFSGHKYGALAGTGLLLVRTATPLEGVIKGGQQEWGRRAGTENILGAATLGATITWQVAHTQELTDHVSRLQERLEEALARRRPEIKILGPRSRRAPHITYLWLPGVIDEHIVHKLDLAGLAVSSGSACSSGATLPSATLLALGYRKSEAFGGLRVSFGRQTTGEEIGQFIDRLAAVLGQA